MLVQLQMAWRERLLPCPGLGPIWGAQAGPKEVVLLVKTKPSPRWLDKVVTAEERPEKEKRIKETGCPSLPLPPQLHTVCVLEPLAFSCTGPSA